MNKPDMTLFVLAVMLVLLGVLMVYGASTTVGRRYYQDADAFLIRQGIAALIGIACMVFLVFVPYTRIGQYTVPIVIITLILLVAVLIPGIGRMVNSARRWIVVGPLQIQPSEIAKLAIVTYLAMIMTKKREQGMAGALRGFLPPLIVTVLFSFLIYLEPDFSTAMILLSVGIVIFLMGGVPLGHVIGLVLSALPFALVLVFSRDYMKGRLFAHLDPLADPGNHGYQLVQSLLSFQNGGSFGTGLGRGVQKMGALPEAHTDFIMAAHAEEIGAFGISILLLLVLALLWRIFRVAARAPDGFGRLFSFGIAMLLGWQALVNVAMVTGLLPTTGLPFPLFSYGGSSLVMTCVALGIVLNISRHCET